MPMGALTFQVGNIECLKCPGDVIKEPVLVPWMVPGAPYSLSVELAKVGDLDPRELGLLDDPVTGSGDVTQARDTCLEEDRSKCP